MRYARHLATVIGTKRRGFDSRHARFLNACMVSEKFKRDPMVSNVDQTVSKEIKRFRKKSKRFRKQESDHRRAWRHLDRDQSGKVLKTGFECTLKTNGDHLWFSERSPVGSYQLCRSPQVGRPLGILNDVTRPVSSLNGFGDH